MKIIYNKNPLYSTIELDEHEKRELWYKIKIEEMEDRINDARLHLSKGGKFFDINRAKDELDIEALDERCDLLLQYALNDLNSFHIGDCTCQACGCGKCWAENLLGIDTIEGLGAHAAYKIDNAFGKNNENSVEEALEYLKNYDPKPDWDGYEQYLSRWKAEADTAYKWLLTYTNNHIENKIKEN